MIPVAEAAAVATRQRPPVAPLYRTINGSVAVPRHIASSLGQLGPGALAVVAAVTSSLPATAALFAVSGLFLGPFTGALFTVREDRAPEAARAQVFTISAGLKTTAAAAGAALGGAIAGFAAPVQLLLVAGSPLLAGLLGSLVLPRRFGATSTSRAMRSSLP